MSTEKANKNLFNKKDEEFRKKHHSLMKRVLSKMIENNANHMKVLDRNKQFYKEQSSSQVGIQRTLSLNLLEKPKKHTKEKESHH